MAEKVVLSAKSVSKDYGSFQLENVSLELLPGQLFGCLGPNGSGKTTLVKILTGQITPTSGDIDLLGVDVASNSTLAKEKIGIIPEQESPPSFLTLSEYLDFVCNIRKVMDAQGKISQWLDFFDCAHEKDTLIKDLSRGTKQKIIAIQAFIHEPRLVFIDEPLVNLDPLIQKKFKVFLKKYVKQGNSIYLSTHMLSIAEEICTHIGILRKGSMIVQGSLSSVKKKRKKLEDYFIEAITHA